MYLFHELLHVDLYNNYFSHILCLSVRRILGCLFCFSLHPVDSFLHCQVYTFFSRCRWSSALSFFYRNTRYYSFRSQFLPHSHDMFAPLQLSSFFYNNHFRHLRKEKEKYLSNYLLKEQTQDIFYPMRMLDTFDRFR